MAAGSSRRSAMVIPRCLALLSSALGLSADEMPFPWQCRLLEKLIDGDIPQAFALPSGLGKAKVMALGLRGPLPISTLRGRYLATARGSKIQSSWQSIVAGTIDMIGSRLLFARDGASRKMRPFPAGLLSTDALFILDEAHLVPPFEHLLRSVETSTAFHGRAQGAPWLRRLRLMARSRPRGDRRARASPSASMKRTAPTPSSENACALRSGCGRGLRGEAR